MFTIECAHDNLDPEVEKWIREFESELQEDLGELETVYEVINYAKDSLEDTIRRHPKRMSYETAFKILAEITCAEITF